MKILLAIDDSEFSRAAVEAAILQIRPDQAQVLVLHVLDWNDFMPSPFPSGGQEPMYSPPQLESIIENATKKAHELAANAAEHLRLAGFEASASVRQGDPKTIILDCATEWRPDLIIVGSHGRWGLARFVMGSVSEAVARYAHCSVEIARLPSKA